MLGGQHQVGLERVGEAGVDEEVHAGSDSGVDHVAVLGEALADLAAGDQQQSVDAHQGLLEGVRVVVGGNADVDAQGGQRGGLIGVADHGHDRVGGLGAEEFSDGKAAELAGGGGDGDGHAGINA